MAYQVLRRYVVRTAPTEVGWSEPKPSPSFIVRYALSRLLRTRNQSRDLEASILLAWFTEGCPSQV